MSTMMASYPSLAASATPAAAMDGGGTSRPCVKTGTPIRLPSACSCSMAAGRYTSHATSSTRLPSASCRRLASLAAAVVLPTPCSPAIRMTWGPASGTARPALSPPIKALSSSYTTCQPGLRVWGGVREG